LFSGKGLSTSERTVRIDPGTTCVSWSASLATVAAGFPDGSVSIVPLDQPPETPTLRLLGLPDSGWAAFWGDHRYRLEGDPAGRFWWRSGLCRFEPGELDRYGVERI
jgi:hypothetical protein